MSNTRQAVEAYLSSKHDSVFACETIRRRVENDLGRPVSGTSISRIMGNLGWRRFDGLTSSPGKEPRKAVMFARPRQGDRHG